MIGFLDAPPAPRGLLYLATFSAAERAEIAATAELMASIRAAAPADWPEILDRHRRSRHADMRARTGHLTDDADGMRRQALSDVQEAASTYAALRDGRRNGLFCAVCRLAKYVVNGVISEAELRDALCAAAAANGALAKHGARWAECTIGRALSAGRNDTLPPLARRFRSGGGRHGG